VESRETIRWIHVLLQNVKREIAKTTKPHGEEQQGSDPKCWAALKNKQSCAEQTQAKEKEALGFDPRWAGEISHDYDYSARRAS
jgi:hypothetical protein